jgi:signal transduction histidine kinase
VTLRRDAGRLHVIIEDDGKGFDAVALDEPVGRRGLGLLGMRERAAQLKGSLQIDSAPGQGTRVVVDLPAKTGLDEAHG